MPPSPTNFRATTAQWIPAVTLCAGIITILLVATYSSSWQAPFIFDDAGAIVRNPTIRDLWSWEIFRPPADGSTTTGRPLLNASFAFNYAISGLNPWSYRLTNIALHGAAALALFGLVRRTLAGAAPLVALAGSANVIALCAAALWAVHPLQTESVSCVAQRTEVLCGVFYLLSLYAFSRAATADGPSSGNWRLVSIVSAALGMASKEVMVTAPVVVLVYDVVFFGGTISTALRRGRRFYAALFSTWIILLFALLSNSGTRGTSAGFGLGVSAWQYLLTQCEAIVIYLKLSLWPHPLVLDYGTGVVDNLGAVWWQAALIVSALAVTVFAFRRHRPAAFCGFCFFTILSPSSTIVPLVAQTIAEHRMYLPLGAVLTLGVCALFKALPARAALAAVGMMAVAYGGLTFARNTVFRDEIAIWRANVRDWPANARGHLNLAVALDRAGRTAEALPHFAEAVARKPDYVAALFAWGSALMAQGDHGLAVEKLLRAVELSPGFLDARVNLANALVKRGRAREAIPHLEAVVKNDPQARDARYNLGIALAIEGRDREAAPLLAEALRLDPKRVEAGFQLARIAERAGDLATAAAHYRSVLQIYPAHAGAHARVGLLLARENRLSEARDHLVEALRLDPGDVDSLANLGNVYLLAGSAREAVACYEGVLRARPDDARVRENLQLAREALAAGTRR